MKGDFKGLLTLLGLVGASLPTVGRNEYLINSLERVVIQGAVDADPAGKVSQSDISKTVDFCLKAYEHASQTVQDSLMRKLKIAAIDIGVDDPMGVAAKEDFEKTLTPEESEVLNILLSRRLIREDNFNIDSFTLDVIDGFAPKMERGLLGLVKAEKVKVSRSQLLSVLYLKGQHLGVRDLALGNGENDVMEPVEIAVEEQ